MLESLLHYTSRPEVVSGLLIFFCVALVVAIILLIVLLTGLSRKTQESRMQFAQLETIVKVSGDQTKEKFDSVTKAFMTLNSDLLDSQDRHFTNFLTTVGNNAEKQNKASERLQQAILEQIQLQTQTQDNRLDKISTGVANNINEMRKTLAGELEAIRNANDKALAGMRETVDEKLQSTLNSRITESFKTVEAQLMSVHKGLGEMREMAQNVDGLRRVLSNVKTRGTFGEVQLGMILQEILTPNQYATNVATRPHSSERVEFAVRLPGPDDHSTVWLPIDAKFPIEDYDRLIQASEKADPDLQKESLAALQARILLEAKKIRDKYVEVPYTTEFAVMYLPVEGLWSEVVKMPGLVERVQREFHITIAGPTVLSALINSLQMGFRTLAIEKKSAEVWKLLGEVKMEFQRFTDVVDGLEKKVETMKNALGTVRTRTNVMNRRLKAVETQGAVVDEEPQTQALPLDRI